MLLWLYHLHKFISYLCILLRSLIYEFFFKNFSSLVWIPADAIKLDELLNKNYFTSIEIALILIDFCLFDIWICSHLFAVRKTCWDYLLRKKNNLWCFDWWFLYLQEETEAEIKQLRRSLNFRATPMPSFYHEGMQRDSDRNKVWKLACKLTSCILNSHIWRDWKVHAC